MTASSPVSICQAEIRQAIAAVRYGSRRRTARMRDVAPKYRMVEATYQCELCWGAKPSLVSVHVWWTDKVFRICHGCSRELLIATIKHGDTQWRDVGWRRQANAASKRDLLPDRFGGFAQSRPRHY